MSGSFFEPDEHPELDELLAEPPSAKVVAHLQVCTRCRVERRMILKDAGNVDLDDAPAWTVALSSLHQPSRGRATSRAWSTVEGPLVERAAPEGDRLAMVVERQVDEVSRRFDALAAVEHPSLTPWRALDPESGQLVATCEPMPPRPVSQALTAEPGLVAPLLTQLVLALMTLHRAELAHGGLRASAMGVTPTGRLVVGPAVLGWWPTEEDDRRDLGLVLANWAEEVAVPLLGPLAEDLREQRIETDGELLTRVLGLVDAHRSGALRYEDLGLLGKGGMGRVIRARDQLLDRTVALKSLRPDLRGAEERFLEEPRITAQLQHPGVVPIHEIGRLLDGRPYYTMEEVRGVRLTLAIREVHAVSGDGVWRTAESGWSFRRLMGVFERICDTVAYAHSQRIVHRDLKPDNVMVGAFGEVRVVDWGLAVTAPSRGERAGTQGYMAPELDARGEVDERADVFALGRVLEDILRGPRRDGGPPDEPELIALVTRCTAERPSDRPADAAEVRRLVQDWLDGAARRERADAAVDDVASLIGEADAALAEAEQLRERAEAILEDVETWDPPERKEPAWALQERAAQCEARAAVLRTRYEQGLRAALQHEPTHRRALDGIGALYRAQLVSAERTGNPAEALRLETLLETHDRGRHRDWLQGDGAVTLITDPPGAVVELEEYVERHKRLVPEPRGTLGTTPLREVRLGRGSWRLRIRHPQCEEVLYPVFIERGEHWDGVPPEGGAPQVIPLPPKGSLGPDDVYVPAGWFVSGGDPRAVDSLPMRRLWVDGVLVKRTVVTVADYARYLDELGASVDDTLMPVRLVSLDSWPLLVHSGGRWLPNSNVASYSAQLDWPVVGVSWFAAVAYAEWLARRDGRDWRLPHEHEWEKSARGSDHRTFPWGDHADAAFCHVLGSRKGAVRPTVAGAQPVDRSPYGIREMAGNVFQWCANPYFRRLPSPLRLHREFDAGDKDLRVVRGGSYSARIGDVRAASRTVTPPAQRSNLIGFRVCANYNSGSENPK